MCPGHAFARTRSSFGPSSSTLAVAVEELQVAAGQNLKRWAGNAHQPKRKRGSHVAGACRGPVEHPVARPTRPAPLFSTGYSVCGIVPAALPQPLPHCFIVSYAWLDVVSGPLRLVVSGHDPVLQAREAAEFDTRVPHCSTALTRRPSSSPFCSARRVSACMSAHALHSGRKRAFTQAVALAQRGRPPRRLSPDDEDCVVATATTRPNRLGHLFTRWSVRTPASGEQSAGLENQPVWSKSQPA